MGVVEDEGESREGVRGDGARRRRAATARGDGARRVYLDIDASAVCAHLM